MENHILRSISQSKEWGVDMILPAWRQDILHPNELLEAPPEILDLTYLLTDERILLDNASRSDKAILQKFNLNSSNPNNFKFLKGLFGLDTSRYRCFFENNPRVRQVIFHMFDTREKRLLVSGTCFDIQNQVWRTQLFARCFQQRSRFGVGGKIYVRLWLPIPQPRLFIRMIDSLQVIPNQTLQQRT